MAGRVAPPSVEKPVQCTFSAWLACAQPGWQHRVASSLSIGALFLMRGVQTTMMEQKKQGSQPLSHTTDHHTALGADTSCVS